MSELTDLNNKTKVFGCRKCCVKLKDVKLLKLHFWKVHITKNDISNALNSLNKNDKNEDDSVNNDNDSPNNSQQTQPSNDQSYSKKKINVLDSLSSEDIKYFNLTDSIDEADLAKTAEKFYSNDKVNFSKVREIMPNRIAWAPWRSFMWPCLIKKFSKDARGNFKVHVNYYEANDKKSTLFKFDPSKIELFFRPDTEKHFEYKQIGADYKHRFNFFASYTDAIRDFVKRQSMEESIGLENLNKKSDLDTIKSNDKYLINGKQFTLDEVKEYAKNPYSNKQLEINKERIQLSKNLLDILESKECQEFLISIVKNEIACKRHNNYLKGDKKTRKEMKFISPGPLVLDDQQKLVRIIKNVTSIHFKDKPENLRDYEYDVLYPEAVIWGLRKLNNLTYAVAEKKYKQGFTRSDEENIKQKCNQLLINLEDNNDVIDQNLPTTQESEELEDLNQVEINDDSSIPDLDL